MPICRRRRPLIPSRPWYLLVSSVEFMVTPRTILLPTDFTGRCDRSRDRAVLLARAWDARLVLLHVLEDDTTIPWDREEANDRAQATLESEVKDDNISICTGGGVGAV